MTLSTLTTLSAFTNNAPLSPTYFNSKWSEVQLNVSQINSDASNFGFSRSGSTVSLEVTNALVAKSIDSGGEKIDIRAFGAVGDGGTTDNKNALRAAMAQAEITGIPLFIPNGNFYTTSMLTIAASTTTGVAIVGQSRRDSILQFSSSARTGLQVGDGTANVSYVRLENLSVIAGTSGHSGCGVALLRPQQITMNRVNIEDFSGVDGIGLWMEGSLTSSPPHAYFGHFQEVLVSNVRWGVILKNADENSFYNLDVGLTSTTSSKVTALTILQGRNNRFSGTVLAGNTTVASRISYVGLHLASPTTGDNYQNQFYGLVAEGFDAGIWVDSNATRSMIVGYNGSICSSFMSDAGAETVFIAPQHTSYQWPSGTSVLPSFTFSAESRLGWYRSGSSAMALSLGTLDLRTGTVKLSVGTIGATTNMGSTELALVFAASGVSLIYRSGATAYVVGQSSQSAAA